MLDQSPEPIAIRPATAADAYAVAALWLRSFDAALPTVTRAHSDDEVRQWIREVVIARMPTWVATAGPEIVGMMVVHEGDLDQLYLDPAWRGRGIGEQLLATAKRESPRGLALWTFQVNTAARRFYERHGFLCVQETDGSGNEEREPDARYVWAPG